MSADKGTLTSFSDPEQLRKVQFPAAKSSQEGTPKTIGPNGISEDVRINLSWTHVTCTLPVFRGLFEKKLTDWTKQPRRKTVLRNLTGSALPGDIVAVLGPPNAGKSTLLSILSGFCREGYDGEILVNGAKLSAEELSSRSCFVPQTDLHMDCFSVKETLWLAAELKYPTSVERKDKFRAVVNAMERWGLMDVRRVPVAKISKTHKRLLTCAEQLINAQPLIFVDDPTRNVDASQARICMRTLKYLAYKGHTVVAVISYPSINMMKYFNKLYVLTEGRLIYSGSPMEMKSSLGAHGFVCPAELPITEYMLQVSAKMHGGLRALAETEAVKAREALEAKSSEAGPSDAPVVTVDPGFKKEGADGNEEAKPSSRRKGSMANIFEGRVEVDSRDHLSLIFNRFIFYTYRSSVYMAYRQFVNLSLIIVFANVFKAVGYDSSFVHMDVSFICLHFAFLSLFSLFNATVKILSMISEPIADTQAAPSCQPLLLALRCKAVKLDARVLVLMFSLAAGIFNYYLSHQLREESRIFFFLCFSFQVCVLSQALGMLIGSCFDYEIGCMVSATVFAHALLFLGFFFPAKDLAVHAVWLPYTSYLFYAFNGAMTAIFGWKRTLRCPEGSPRSCPFSSGDQVL
ncbi:hypothetical protein HPB47_008965 [Ixodes persulcatus]|uniref:Uncharacterized protein n=1 Tax=Ixodes persulcatus TaxID=34615 RepID=A0AC60P3J8_IXOPE|nr:hypothetical protein HPB47_008965 [Ixodes persulcatus]